jgi:hypothetical protein
MLTTSNARVGVMLQKMVVSVVLVVAKAWLAAMWVALKTESRIAKSHGSNMPLDTVDS